MNYKCLQKSLDDYKWTFDVLTDSLDDNLGLLDDCKWMFDVLTDSLDDNLGLLDDCKWMFDVSTDSLDDNLGRLHSNKDALLGHLHSNSSAPWASALQQPCFIRSRWRRRWERQLLKTFLHYSNHARAILLRVSIASRH